MDDGEGGRWSEGPLLPKLPDPPIDRVQVRGASLVRVYRPPGERPPGRDGGRGAIILAWARLSDGGWGVLMAWSGYWMNASNRTDARERWGWVRLEPERVKPQRPLSGLPSDRPWHGELAGFTLDNAMYHAAVELPLKLREAAVTPRPWTEG